MSAQTPDVLQIFNDAAEISDAEQRIAYLHRACGEDRALRAEVEELLQHDAELGSLQEGPNAAIAPTLDFAPIAERPGTMIGRYKLVHEIGHGGMGVVYMAEQKEPVKRRVALKIIKPGMDTREVVARFNSERQALAMMDHQCVAHVLDGGSTESGRPYFVMELVDGTPITEYCDECRYTTRQRLELFIQVCDAVQHAHQKGVIHRDIKPSNILVTHYDAAIVPKVIDFGIAKAVHQPLTDASVYTQVSQMIGTPLYMSPEQAERTGQDVDTRTDVYALGVLLYELLTGTTPFDRELLRNSGLDEVKRIIREEDPLRPSTRLSTLGAALDTVVGKHHTDRRTLTHELSGELDCIVMKAMEKDRNRRYESANDFARDLQRYLDDEPVQACPPSKAYRLGKFYRRNKAAFAAAALVLLSLVLGLAGTTWQAIRAAQAENLAEQRLTEVDEEHRLAQANYVRAREAVKQMLTRVADEELGRIPEMKDTRLSLLEDAAAFYTKLLELNPRDSQAYFERGEVYRMLARYKDALADFDDAIEFSPDNAAFHAHLAVFLARKCTDVAYRDPRRALVHAKRAVELAPASASYRTELARTHFLLGAREEAEAEVDRLARMVPELTVTYGAAEAYGKIGDAYRIIGDAKSALPYLEKAVADPAAADLYQWRLANVLVRLGEKEKAIGAVEKACEIELNRPFTHWKCNRLAVMLCSLGEDEKALAFLSKAIEINPKPNKIESYSLYCNRGDIHCRLGMHASALADYSKCLELAPFRSFSYKRRGLAYFRLCNYDKALADIAKAIELKPDDWSNITWINLDEVAQCPDESFRKGILELADKVVTLNGGASTAHATRLGVYAALGREEEALAGLKTDEKTPESQRPEPKTKETRHPTND